MKPAIIVVTHSRIESLKRLLSSIEHSDYIYNDITLVISIDGGAFENEDWLISPPMDLNLYTHETLTFFNALNYTGPAMEVKISTDYSGSGDPNIATWSDLTYIASGGSWEWVSSGDVDISGFNGSQVYVAFKYISNTSEAATWEVDDILITGQSGVGIDEIYSGTVDGKFFVNSTLSNLEMGGSLNDPIIEIFSFSNGDVLTASTSGSLCY